MIADQTTGTMANDIPISDREREILRLVATGASNQQIAQQLTISINTVKVHLRNIFSKIGVVSRTEATVYAISNGLVAVDMEAVALSATMPELLEDEVTNEATDLGVEEEPASLVIPDEPVVRVPDPAPIPIPLPPSRRLPLFIGIAVGLALLIAVAVSVQIVSRPAAPTETPTQSSIAPATPDPNQRWFLRAPLPNSRDDAALTAYDQERKLYLIGGQVDGVPSAAVDRYDPESNLWVSLTDKPTAVSHAGAIVLRGRIYVPGGELAGGKVSDILEIYDPHERRWDHAAPLPAGRSRYALVAIEGQIYVIGGRDATQARSEIFIYNPESDIWSEGPPLPSPRQDAGAAVVSGRIFVVGGVGDGGVLRESIRLDPSLDGRSWDVMAPLPQPMISPGAVSVINTLLIFDAAAAAGWQYDQTADAWQPLDIPVSASLAPRCILLESSIYFLSGRSAAVSGKLSEYRVIYTTFVPGRAH